MRCLLLLIPLAGGVLGVALPGPNVPKVMTKHVNYEPPYENNYYNEYQYYEEYYYGPGGQTAYAVLPGSTRRIPGSVTTTVPPTAPSDEPQETPPVDFLPEIDSGFWFDEYLDEYFGYYDFSDDSFPAALQDFAPGLSSYNTNDFDDDDLPPTIIIGGQQFDTTSRYCLQPPCDDADAALNDDEGEEEEEDGGDARDNIVPRSPQQGVPPVQGLPPLDPKNFATTQDLIFEIAVRQETEREYQLWKASRAPPKQPQNLNDRLSAPGIEMLERASFRAAAIARLEEAKAAKASHAGQSSAAAAASASASQAQSEAAADKSKADAASAAAATGDTAKAVQIALDKKTPPVLPGTGAVVQVDSKIEPLVIGKKVAEAAAAPLSRADRIKALHEEAKRQAQKAASIPKPHGIIRRAASPQEASDDASPDVDDLTATSNDDVDDIHITTFIRHPVAQQTRNPSWLPGSNGGAIRDGDHDLASPSPSADPSTVNSAVFNSILSSLMNVANQPKSTSQPQSTTKKPSWLPGSNGGVVLGGGNGNLASLSRTPDPTMTNSDLLNRVLSSLKSAANQPQSTTKPWWLPGSNGGVVVGGGNGNLASAPPSSSPSSSSSSWSTSSTSSSSTPAPLDADSSSTSSSSSQSSPSSTPSSPSNDFDTIITALLATTNQSSSPPSSPPPDFSYSLIRDITNTFFLAADDSGTVGLTSDPPTADAFASKTFALFKGALAADARRRLFVYYPATMEALGVSRFRLAALNETAFDARAVAGVPVRTDGGDGGGGLVERDGGGGENGAVLVPVDAEGVGYAFVVCDVVADGVTENKLFIVKDLDAGVQTLLDQAVREEVTGGEVEGCWPVALRSPVAAGL